MRSLRLNVRQITVSDYPVKELLDKILPPYGKIPLPDDYGIITATNDTHFFGFQLLVHSINKRYDTTIGVYNVGMRPDQLEWCRSIPNLLVLHFEVPGDMPNYWQAWVKPFYISSSPFRKNLWIDADCIVVGNLYRMIREARGKSFFTIDYTGVGDGILNKPNLYKYLPIKDIFMDVPPLLNTGIFMLDKEEEGDIIEEWLKCVKRAFESENIRNSILCWDQGACKWALQKCNKLNLILENSAYNYPDKQRQFAYSPNREGYINFFSCLIDDMDNLPVIVHWMGSPKPWHRWKGIFNL